MIFVGVFAFVYIYLALDFLGPLGLGGGGEALGLVALLAPFACIIWLFRIFWNRMENPGKETVPDQILVWSAFLSMGVISFIFVLSLIRDLISLVLLMILRTPPPLHGPASFWIILLASLICAALGFKNARYELAVSPVTAKLDGLPRELKGFKIAQISDLHIGSTTHTAQIERVVQAVNGLNVDVVVLTGDIVDGYASELVGQIALLAQLKSRFGSFYVTGNHEHYWGAAAITDEIKRAGIHVLANENRLIEKEGRRILIAGVPDYMAARTGGAEPDPKLALNHTVDHAASAAGVEDISVKIILAHQPSMADAAAAAGFDIQFSGHTHGGQFFPWTYAVKFAHKYPRGMYRLGKMWLYVNRGTGYWGPPLRLGSPAEVTFMTLT